MSNHRKRAARSAQTASVIVCRNASGDTFVAQVRELDNSRTYLQRWPTREAALAACAEYISTGHRPPKQQTGPKRGQRCPRKTWPVQVDYSADLAKPLPTAERLARIAVKAPTVRSGVRLAQVQAMADAEPRIAAARKRQPSALPPQSPPAPQDSGAGVKTPTRANSGERGAQIIGSKERLEKLKAAYRRTA